MRLPTCLNRVAGPGPAGAVSAGVRAALRRFTGPTGLLPAAVILGAAVGACASQGPKPTDEMTRAGAMVEQADRSGAQRYAAADLQRAHDELTDADRANVQGHYDEARRFAESAEADADVAMARAAAGDAERAANEVQQGNDTLREQTEHGSGQGPGASLSTRPVPGSQIPPDASGPTIATQPDPGPGPN